jgi:gluconolactonase
VKKLTIAFLATALSLSAAELTAQPAARGGVERLDAAIDALVGPEVKVEKLAEQDGFFEGPVWHRGPGQGFLTFSDVTQNTIFRWDPAGGLMTYVDKVFTGKDTSSVITFERNGRTYQQPGPNGQTLDKEGRLVFCAMGSGKIMRREPNGSLTVLVSAYNGRHLNAPNDLVYKSDGALYFTDIRANSRTTDENPPEGVPHTGVYRFKDGQLTLLVSDLATPNGLAFSPDEKVLYVNDIRVRKMMRYDVNADGALANGRVFMDMMAAGDSRPGNPDGMRVDTRGNVWTGWPGGIWIISPEGKHIGTIVTPERISNLAFGDADGMTVYATAPTQLYRIRVNVAGLRP